jgi:GNAT superfamily N-acetyltransferase
MPLIFRDAGPADAEAAFEVQRSASLAALGHVFPPQLYPYPDAEVRGRWRELLAESDAHVVLAEQAGAALGVAAIVPCWLHGFYVVPGEWGTGLAPRLHDAAVEHLRSRGCDEARLWVLEANARARRFYERHGWRPNGDTRIVPYPPHPLDVGYSLTL